MQFDPAQESGGVFAIRSISQSERALLAQWFATTDRTGPQAVVAAYVSERSRDNPRLRNMIIIAEHTKSDMAFLIYCPVGESVWIVECGRSGKELGHYRTLPDALSTIRPHGIMPSSVADCRQLVAHSNVR
jgi:hypothetical protein